MGMRLRTGWLVAAGTAVVLAIGAAGVYRLAGGDQEGAAGPATALVRRGTVTAAVSAAGTLQPAQTRGLGFSMDGTVTEVRVRAGDQVTPGQVLARIDDTDAKEKVSRAQAALDAAEESLAAAEQSVAAADEASRTGCVATAAYPSPTATASSSRSPSAGTGPGGEATPPGATATVPSGAATTVPSRGGPTVPSGGGPAGRTSGCAGDGGASGGSDEGGGPDRILSAQQQVNNARLQLDNAERDLAGTTITAPIAGRVLSVAGAVGSRATTGGSGFIVLGDVAEMQVKADFPEADAIGLAVGQAATVTLADRPGEPLPAKVTQVDPVGTADGQMVRFGVLLAFDTVPGDLLAGQSANVRVETRSASDVLYVPAGAVHGSTVRVLQGAAIEERRVGVGLRGDQYTEIRSGLSEGETVLTSW